VTIPVSVELDHDRLRAHGSDSISQSAFGIAPVRAAGGGVRVKDEVELRFDLVARAAP
jgi:hypothetical protein